MRYTGLITSKHAYGKKKGNKPFTDEKLVGKANAFQLNKLEVFTSNGIVVGFKLLWTLDSVKFTKEHNAKN